MLLLGRGRPALQRGEGDSGPRQRVDLTERFCAERLLLVGLGDQSPGRLVVHGPAVVAVVLERLPGHAVVVALEDGHGVRPRRAEFQAGRTWQRKREVGLIS